MRVLASLISKGVTIDQVESTLWKLKDKFDRQARFFKNMHDDILNCCNRLDNEMVSVCLLIK